MHTRIHIHIHGYCKLCVSIVAILSSVSADDAAPTVLIVHQ